MDVKTVCLGMLDAGPASGYDLKKEFESSFAHFFAAGFGSIYPALSALASDGLVSFREVPQEGRPDRKVYEITDAGRTKLLESLGDPDPSHKVRSEFLATLCFSHLMTREQIETVLENRRAEIRRYLELFDELEQVDCEDWTPGHQFVLGFGKAMIEAKLDYIDANADLLFERTRSEDRHESEPPVGARQAEAR